MRSKSGIRNVQLFNNFFDQTLEFGYVLIVTSFEKQRASAWIVESGKTQHRTVADFR